MSLDLQDDVEVMTQLYTLNPAPSETEKTRSKDEQWTCTKAANRNKEWWTQQQQTCVYWSRGPPPLTVIRRGSPSSSAPQRRRWCWVTSCWAKPVNLRAPLDSNLSHFCIIDVRNSTFRWVTASEMCFSLMQNTFHATSTQKIDATLRDKEKQLFFIFFLFLPSSD